MRLTNVFYTSLLFITTGFLFLTGCSEVNNEFRMPAEAELQVHARGFADPEANNFHGIILKDNEWDWTGCQECHGRAPQFTGGVSRVSCAAAGCHVDFMGRPKTVATCNTCHGDFRAAATDFASFAPPRDLNKNTETTAVGVGAHQIHLLGEMSSTGIRCNECHVIPTGVFVENHLEPSGPNKVVFGELASIQTASMPVTDPPKYNPDAIAPTCANTYCHGNFSGGNNFSPVWTIVDGSQGQCGTCHGNPVTGNPLPKTTAEGGPHIPGVFNCQACHWSESDRPIARRLPDGSYVIEEKDLHIDGAIYITGQRRTDW